MVKSPRRFLKITSVVILIVGALFFIAGYFVSNKLEEIIREKLLAVGFHVKSVSITFLNKSVELDSIYYTPVDTSQYPYSHHAAIAKITISGLHIYTLLTAKEIIIEEVRVSEGKIQYNKNQKIKKDTSSRSKENKIKSILIKHVLVEQIHLSVLNDSLIESTATIDNFELNDALLSFKRDTTYSVGQIRAQIENVKQSKKGGLHTFSISTIKYNSKDAQLEIDSFRVTPNYNKADFARIAKIQKTRLDIILPKIFLEGIDQKRFFSDSTLEIERIRISKPLVHAYRDKHYPFVRDWIMPLPIEGIRRLPFKLKVDSIIIKQANIVYEEFSEKGLQATGTITFDQLDATFSGLSTVVKYPDKKAFCTLVADCKVMNNGILHATFKLPLNNTVNYEAFGNLRKMDLTSLNPSLGNLSRIEIKEGNLNDLYFNFSYNDDFSKGEVLINYSSLKLSALKKDKSHEVNKLLSAAINAIVKSDKDKSVDKSKRTGAIDIERDKKRFVFQLWWKSILDGLQSTFVKNSKKKKTQKGSSK